METGTAGGVTRALSSDANHEKDSMSVILGILPFLLFIVSGAWGLVYEVTWARYLCLFIGNTTLAHMCVLVAFMGGLALGSLVIGMKTVRVQRCLAAYGHLEIGIGLYAILYPFLIKKLQAATLGALTGLDFGSPLILIGKLSVSMLALLLPTFLMGGTFPMLMKHFKPQTEREEDKAEWLYLANCAGAVGGTLLAGFVLVPWLGLTSTLLCVGAANVGIGLVAVLLGQASEFVQNHKTAANDTRQANQQRHPLSKLVYAAIGISGATAMTYELVWIRMFAVTLGGSTYSFTLMLSAFITGIALGSLTVGLIRQLRSNPILWFGISELAIALAIVGSIPMYERLPWIFWKWSSLLQWSMETVGLHNLMKYSLCFLVMLIPTFFFGMTLPLAIKAVTRPDEGIGRDTGFVYGANTFGTLAGSLLTGLVLIPSMGLRASLHVALIGNLLVAALMIIYSGTRRRWTLATVGSIVVLGTMLANPPWNPVAMVKGTFRLRGGAPDTWGAYLVSLEDCKVLFADEDGSANVAVTVSPTGPQLVMDTILLINGKPDGTAWSDMVTQKLVAQIPLMFHPHPEEVLIVGLGTGASAGAALTHPSVRVDCVEISPAVANALRYFDGVNYSVRKNPRFKLIIEDARTLVAMTPKKYDVIVNEPTNPWVAGVGNLFTLEYFQSLDRILKPDGLASIWLQGYEMSDDLVQMVARTVRCVFPYVCVFAAGNNDYILLVSRKPLNPDFEAMERLMQIKSVRADFMNISIDSLAALLSRQMLSAKTFDQCIGSGPLNTDDLPLLEYKAPVAHYLDLHAMLFKEMDERRRKVNNLFITDYLRMRPLNGSMFHSIVRANADPRMATSDILLPLLGHYLSRWGDDPDLFLLYARLTMNTQPANAMWAAELATQMEPTAEGYDLQADILFGELLRRHSALTPQDFSPVLKLLDKAIRLDPKNPDLRKKRERIHDFVTR